MIKKAGSSFSLQDLYKRNVQYVSTMISKFFWKLIALKIEKKTFFIALKKKM